MSDHTLKSPMVYTLVHISEPGFQVYCVVFKEIGDAIQAGYNIIQEKSSIYQIDADALIEKKGEYVFEHWHTLTFHRERISLFQNPVNVFN